MALPNLPKELDEVGGLVVLGLDAEGAVMRSSRELARIQAQTRIPAWQLLTQPTFSDLQARTPDVAGIVHRGLVTLGDPNGEMRGLTGVIYRDESQLLCVLGYDADELERMARGLLELSDEQIREQRELVRANREIVQVSLTDSLTGVGNRRSFDDKLEEEVARSTRYGTPLSVVLFDLDRFKRINDEYGHPAGDKVLKEIGAMLTRTVRKSDLAARTGGEEFAVVMPGVSTDAATKSAERLRKQIASDPVAGLEGITASFGVTERREGDTAASLYSRVDSALYAAKDGGRNQVVSN